jgi:GNAT superfamily N-acetyltransferase
MKIQRAVIEDALEILALQKLAYRSEAEIYNDFSIQPLLQTLEDLRGEFQSHDVFKVLQGNNLVASVRTLVKGESCCVGKLMVNPAYQNQGIGYALMSYIENYYNAVKRFELFTGHRSMRNLHLYEKLGYREYRREKTSDRLTLVFLEKLLEAT